MAFQYQNNLTPATGAVATFSLKAALKAAGWTIPQSSDGLTYNSSGDQISSGASGANGMANASAWFVGQDPGGVRQFCFQRSTTVNTTWRIKYSKSAKFTGGTPGITRVPSATDEQVLMGGGTDAAPTFATLYGGADGTYRFSAAADNASPYNFYAFAFPTGGGTCNSMFLCDAINSSLSSNFNGSDTDPVVINPNTNLMASGLNALNWQGWIDGTTWLTTITVLQGGSNTNSSNGAKSDPVTGKVLASVPFYCNTTGGFLYPKGYGTLWQVLLSNNSGSAFPTPTAFQLVSANDKILIGSALFPWDGSAPTV